MWPFKKRERVFEVKGDKQQWEGVKKMLKAQGFDIGSGSYSDEKPICGCGAKLDIRDFGPKGKIDRDTYYIDVIPEQLTKAEECIAGFVK